MFETSLHSFKSADSLDKRKLWESWLQWANRFSRVDSDGIARAQFDRTDFTIDSFLEMFHDGLDTSDSAGLVSGESGAMVAASKEFVTLESSGEYWVTWSLTLKAMSGGCRFAGGVPFVGNAIVGSAQDFKAMIGWYNNMTLTMHVTRDESTIKYPDGGVAMGQYTSLEDGWGVYGHVQYSYRDPHLGKQPITIESGGATYGHSSVGVEEYYPQIITEETGTAGTYQEGQPVTTYHLSGSGSAYVGRMSGNIGVILSCEPNSTFQILASRLTLHKRVR